MRTLNQKMLKYLAERYKIINTEVLYEKLNEYIKNKINSGEEINLMPICDIFDNNVLHYIDKDTEKIIIDYVLNISKRYTMYMNKEIHYISENKIIVK